MNNQKDILSKAIDAFSEGSVPKGPSEEIVRKTLEKIEKQQKRFPFIERVCKMKSISKLAAAAMILFGISIFFLFSPGPESVALADVYTRVQQAQAFMYKMTMTIANMGELAGNDEMNGPAHADMTVTISQQYGMKMESIMTAPAPQGKTETTTQLSYLLPEDNVMLSILPESKKYQRIEMTEEMLEKTKQQNNDPREMIRQMLNSEYTDLGFSEINGVTVQGFHTADPAYSMGVAQEVDARLWVDVNTWLPVRSEVWLKVAGMEMEYVIDSFQWDVLVSVDDFTYAIPEDYTEMESMKMPEMTQQAAVEGLQLYAKYFDQYPESINIASLVPSMMRKMKELIDEPKTEYAREFARKMKKMESEGQQAVMQYTQKEFAPINSLAMFNMKLVQEKKDPAYYGDRVTPGDGDAVLMRWRVEGNTYKVVFGDLTVVEMPYQELMQIEPTAELAP